MWSLGVRSSVWFQYVAGSGEIIDGGPFFGIVDDPGNVPAFPTEFVELAKDEITFIVRVPFFAVDFYGAAVHGVFTSLEGK
jgi:hypothetical protein